VTDPIRAALFALSLGAVLFSSLGWVSVWRLGAVVLHVDDGVTTTDVANLGTGAETIRVRHRVGEGATRIRVSLVFGGGDRDAQVRVRSVLAIPRSAVSQPSPFRR
jgi:hypothetical protein